MPIFLSIWQKVQLRFNAKLYNINVYGIHVELWQYTILGGCLGATQKNKIKKQV